MNEAMMAVVVASTAFAGLTGIVIGQIKERKPLGKWWNNRQLLIVSCGLGVIVIAFSVLWFLVSSEWDKAIWIIYGFFVAQMFTFWAASVHFWSEK